MTTARWEAIAKCLMFGGALLAVSYYGGTAIAVSSYSAPG